MPTPDTQSPAAFLVGRDAGVITTEGAFELLTLSRREILYRENHHQRYSRTQQEVLAVIRALTTQPVENRADVGVDAVENGTTAQPADPMVIDMVAALQADRRRNDPNRGVGRTD